MALSKVEPVDAVSHDMLVEQTGRLELFQWFLRAHLADTDGRIPTTGEETQLDAAAAAAVAGHL